MAFDAPLNFARRQNYLKALGFHFQRNVVVLTTHRKLELSPVIRKHFPILIDAVENIGSVQIRNIATIGGNIVNAAPSADGATPLITLGALIHIVGPKGERAMLLEEFFRGPGQTLLEEGEIVCEFRIPELPLKTGAAY